MHRTTTKSRKTHGKWPGAQEAETEADFTDLVQQRLPGAMIGAASPLAPGLNCYPTSMRQIMFFILLILYLLICCWTACPFCKCLRCCGRQEWALNCVFQLFEALHIAVSPIKPSGSLLAKARRVQRVCRHRDIPMLVKLLFLILRLAETKRSHVTWSCSGAGSVLWC